MSNYPTLRVCLRTNRQSTGLFFCALRCAVLFDSTSGQNPKQKTLPGDGNIPGCVQIALYESARGLTDSPPDCLLRTAVRRPVRLHIRAKSNTKTPRRETTGCFCVGAADGSRTHLSSLGSLHSTDELQPRKAMAQEIPAPFQMVGVTGLEPMASWSRTKRDTKLRHTPICARFRALWYYNIFRP